MDWELPSFRPDYRGRKHNSPNNSNPLRAVLDPTIGDGNRNIEIADEIARRRFRPDYRGRKLDRWEVVSWPEDCFRPDYRGRKLGKVVLVPETDKGFRPDYRGRKLNFTPILQTPILVLDPTIGDGNNFVLSR